MDLITDIQRFSLNDGPGIRTTVFFKGCNMRCPWCHNPETLSFKPQLLFYPEKCIYCGKCFHICPTKAHKIENDHHVLDRSLCVDCGKCAAFCYPEALVMSGQKMTVEEIMAQIRQDKAYYDASQGGVTLSGGEVLCHTEFAARLARACKEEGISVAIETNLSLPLSQIRKLLQHVDLIMADCKLMDDAMHKKYTGISNETVLANILAIRDIPMIVRTPLIPGVTATQENLRAIGAFLAGKENLLYYELLNFNPLGGSKYQSLQKDHAFAQARPYSPEELKQFQAMAAASGVEVKVGG